ncbi:MAG: tryptophan halogenase [Alphaproteobacteria bacterium]|nr:tryptophan halogenase [Alphaproteobacteria bacterium]
MEDGLYRIIIVGGGTAGWMAAAGLRRQLEPGDYRITLIESDEIGTVGVGEATLPHIKLFNDMLGLDEAEFMRETQATFKLGIEFCGWDRPGSRYIHPFGAFGEPWGGVEFQHHWLRLQAAGRPVAPLQAYSYAVAAARANAFELPDEDPGSIRSTYSYAYHFDAGRFADYLRRYATARGVDRIEGQVCAIDRDGESGALTAVTLKSGRRIEGDLFVDCTGFRSLLLGGQYGVGWDDWTKWLPCDRALAVPCAHGGDLTPYTRATARPAGWQWRIPLQHRIGNGYIFSSAMLSPEEAHDVLLANLDGAPLTSPKLLRFTPGCREVAWRGNCVAVGLASGFLEPLESTSIYLIQAAVIDLVNLIPTPNSGRRPDPRLADEFNRLNAMQYERVRDFLILHYVANRREGEPFWDHLRAMPIPDSLAHKLALFRARGAVPNYQYGLFARDSWLSVLVGQGITPATYDRLAEGFNLETIAAQLDDFRDRIDAGVAAMSPHGAFVDRYCAMPEATSA